MEGRCKFDKEKHIKFFIRNLQVLPSRYQVLDSNRLTIAFFALSGLDLLNALDRVTSPSKEEIIEWIYSLQVIPNKAGTNIKKCGFRGSSTNGVSSTNLSKSESYHDFDSSHIAMTYTGLACLLILGDDLSRVDRHGCLQGVKALQLKDGSFESTLDGSENDMRFIYCACCICTILDDFSAVDEDLAIKYILKSQCFDGAFGQGPGNESHGGSTYCAISSLLMLNRLQSVLSLKDIRRRDRPLVIHCLNLDITLYTDLTHGLQRWCIHGQKAGFHGRPHKDDDTCYSFWIGASLKLIGSFQLCDWDENERYILSTQDSVIGGFGKWPQSHPDALHSYMGLCGLSMMGLYGLNPITPALNISVKASEHMFSLHRKWTQEGTKLDDPMSTMNSMGGHMGSTLGAFVLGAGVVLLPWIYSYLFPGR